MVKVIAKATYQDGKMETILELYQELLEKTRQENGCLSYELYQDDCNPNIFVMVEEWESKIHLAAHQKTEHYLRIIPLLSEYRLSSEVNLYNRVG